MNQLEFQRNHLQMDYYSESYQDFERDFYRYSNMNIPLTFLTDDILKTMATSRKNYFVLNKEKSRDNRDHFFIFEVRTLEENPLIYHYTYKKTTTYLAEKQEQFDLLFLFLIFIKSQVFILFNNGVASQNRLY